MVVCHLSLLNRHFASILHRFLVSVFNLKLDVFHVLVPSLFIMFSSLYLSYYLCRGQKYGLTCLNDRIPVTCLLEFYTLINGLIHTCSHIYKFDSE